MKINMFDTDAKKRTGGNNLSTGLFEDQEDLLIEEIDQENWPAEKLKANRFLQFLANRRLTLTSLALLPKQEQDRLKLEFREN